jgi:hypothetical protein
VDEGENHVQASLESTYTGERHGFANFEAMLEFLRRQMAAQAESSGDREERG